MNNNMKNEREIDLIPDDSCKKTCLRIAMSQVEDVEAELRLPHFRTFGIHKVEGMRHLSRPPTVPAMSVGDACRHLADFFIH